MTRIVIQSPSGGGRLEVEQVVFDDGFFPGWVYVADAGASPSTEPAVLDQHVAALVQDHASGTTAALRAALVPFWTAAEAVTTGTVRVDATGHLITANSNRTTRGSYDATEQAAWTVVSGGGGSLLQTVRAVTHSNTPVTAAAGDNIVIDATGGAVAVTIPSAVGTFVRIARTDATASAVTVTVVGGGTINGDASLSLVGPYVAVELLSDGTNATVLTSSTGTTGPPGPTGATPALSIGTVSTLTAGSSATATVGGTTGSPTLSLGIPTGATGATGLQGITGAAGGNVPIAPAASKSGFYYYCNSPQASGTAAHPLNTPRVTPFLVPYSLSIARLGIDLTAAGEANSVFRIGIWNDDGSGYPGTLALDAGTISTGTGNAGGVATGGTPGMYEIVLGSPLALSAGLYWVGGVVQGATTTAPTVRSVSAASIFPQPFPISSALPAAGGALVGYQGPSQTGALGAFGTPTATPTSIVRVFYKVA